MPIPIFYYTNMFVRLLPALGPAGPNPNPETVISPFLDIVPRLLKGTLYHACFCLCACVLVRTRVRTCVLACMRARLCGCLFVSCV